MYRNNTSFDVCVSTRRLLLLDTFFTRSQKIICQWIIVVIAFLFLNLIKVAAHLRSSLGKIRANDTRNESHLTFGHGAVPFPLKNSIAMNKESLPGHFLQTSKIQISFVDCFNWDRHPRRRPYFPNGFCIEILFMGSCWIGIRAGVQLGSASPPASRLAHTYHSDQPEEKKVGSTSATVTGWDRHPRRRPHLPIC